MSITTMLKGKEWWIEKRGSVSNRRIYPERIVVGDPFKGRVYLPESTCRDFGGMEGTNGEGYDFACTNCGFCSDICEPNYCPNCGAKVVGNYEEA